MTLTKGFTDELKMLNAESVIGASASELLHTTMARVGKHVDNPLRMYAAATPDSKLYFSANVVEVGDGAGKSTLPIEGNIGTFVATNIDMQTGVVTGGTVNMLGGGSFALPASTLNYYRRLCFGFQSDGSVQANFSAESATTGGLSNAGTLFDAMTGLPVGYIDLQCDDIAGKYRTAGSSTSIIENKVGSYYSIMRFTGGGGGSYGLVGDIQTLDATKTANAGTSPKVSRADHVHPITTGAASGLNADSTSGSGSSASLTRADHSHAIASGTPSGQTPDATNAAGSSSNFARADHIHNLPTATPTDVGSSNSQGASTTAFVKADHVHKGLHSLKAETGGTQRFGDIILKKDTYIKITDNGDGSFSFESLADTTDIAGSLKNQLSDSVYELLTPVVFKVDESTFIDGGSLNCAYSATYKALNFSATGGTYISTNLLDSNEFLAIAAASMQDVGQVDLQTYWKSGSIDSAATYYVSRDGGDNWSAITMNQNGYGSGSYYGTYKFLAESTYSTLVTQASSGSTKILNASTVQAVGQSFTLTSASVIKRATLTFTISGTPLGSLYLALRSVSGGLPTSTIYGISQAISASSLTTGSLVIELPETALPAGTFCWAVTTDSIYKDHYTSTTDSVGVDFNSSADAGSTYNGTSWADSGTDGFKYTITGRELDFRIKIVSSASGVNLNGFGVFYASSTSTISVSGKNIQVFKFLSATNNNNEFAITSWIIDKDITKVYWAETGLCLVYPGWQVSGNTIVFPQNTFYDTPDIEVTLVIQQIEGSSFDNSDTNGALLTSNHIGNPTANLDRSVAGRGIYLRNAGGTLMEVALDADNNIIILDT